MNEIGEAEQLCDDYEILSYSGDGLGDQYTIPPGILR